MKNLKNNNKGFSLVELIVVIAIMVVLAVALAPVFTKFVEQSRAATDVSNANALAEAILVEVADNSPWYQAYTDGANITSVGTGTAVMTTVKTWPVPTAKVANNGTFTAVYNSSTNTVSVTVNGYNLINPAHATAYKDGQAAPQ